MESQHSHRKDEHLSLAEKFYQDVHLTDPFDGVRIIHQSLPEISIDDVTTSVNVTDDLSFDWPFYIEAITGGSQRAELVNRRLAKIAARHHIAMACGSQSIALKDPHVQNSFKVVREVNPDGIVIANISAGSSLTQAQAAVDMVAANALELHLNTTQELVMPEGERSFHWLTNIEQIVNHLSVPVIVKEVGFGMSKETVSKLISVGVTVVNVSGRGGTNFVRIEDRRNHENSFVDLNDWGQTAVESLLESCQLQDQISFIAGGGVVSALDVIKCGTLGASAVGVAGFFLDQLIHKGDDVLSQIISNWQTEIKRLLVLCGCHNFDELRSVPTVLSSDLRNYIEQRNIK